MRHFIDTNFQYGRIPFKDWVPWHTFWQLLMCNDCVSVLLMNDEWCTFNISEPFISGGFPHNFILYDEEVGLWMGWVSVHIIF